MRTAHFASLSVIVPPRDYTGLVADVKTAPIQTVGMAQDLRIQDSFGTRSENVIGTPFPVIAPGYQQTTISITKATIDGESFRDLGAFNPLWAHVGSTYRNPLTIDTNGTDITNDSSENQIFPFMFILAVKDKVSNSYAYSSRVDQANRPNTVGTYVCVLSEASISLSSQNTVIMDQLTAQARPITGTWLTDNIRNAFAAEENGGGKNGMRDMAYSVMFGYDS